MMSSCFIEEAQPRLPTLQSGELAREALVRFDHVARFIVYAHNGSA
jgi:hypothetical protein